MTGHRPFRCFKMNPEIIRLAVMLYVRCPLSLRSVEDLLHERGIEVSHETVGAGGTGSARCLPPRSGADGLTGCALFRIGAAIWTRSS